MTKLIDRFERVGMRPAVQACLRFLVPFFAFVLGYAVTCALLKN